MGYIHTYMGTSWLPEQWPCYSKASVENICHALSKHPLASADIFLLNLDKSKKNFKNVNYEVLEDLKEKYDSQNLSKLVIVGNCSLLEMINKINYLNCTANLIVC